MSTNQDQDPEFRPSQQVLSMPSAVQGPVISFHQAVHKPSNEDLKNSVKDPTFNFDYIKTPPGKLKLITAAVGLFTMAFTLAAFDKGYYYNYRCSPSETVEYIHDIDYWKKNTEADKPKPPLPKSCEEFLPVTYEFCHYAPKFQNWKDKQPRNMSEPEVQGKIYKNLNCPSKWLFIVVVVIITVVWIISFLFLVVMLFVDFSKKLPKIFPRIDFIGHLVAAVLFGISAVIMIGFLAWIFLSSFPCTDADFNGKHAKVKPPSSNVTGQRSGRIAKLEYKSRRGRGKLRDCGDYTEATYKQWHILIGVISAAASAVMYVVTAMVIIRKKRGSIVGPPTQIEVTPPPPPAVHSK